MKPLLFAMAMAMAMALPTSATAGVAMETQRIDPPVRDVARQPRGTGPRQPEADARRPLFIVKFVLRPAPEEPSPRIIMDGARTWIEPPAAGGYPVAPLGSMAHDPNTIICHARGCEGRPGLHGGGA